MSQRTVTKRRLLAVVTILMALLLALIPAGPAAAESGTAVVAVIAANQAKLLLVLNQTTANFGTNLDPGGTPSNSPDIVPAFTSAAGAYYVEKAADGGGFVLTVSSNLPFNATICATENTGTSTTILISNGSLRYGPAAPISYAEADALTPFQTTPQPYITGGPAGVSSYTLFYALRILYTDTTGTFQSFIDYTVTQV